MHLKHDQLPTDADGFLVVWGGGDIHPSWYNRRNIASDVYHKPSIRDEQEARMMSKAIEIGLPILGVCRGAQMACALTGGILIQDVSGHHGSHYVKTSDGKRLITSSVHHQMMFPWKVNYELLAWSDPAQSSKYVGLEEEEVELQRQNVEPEVVWFPDIKCLAVQGHPEFMDYDCEMNSYIHELMDKYGLSPRTVS